MSESVVFLKKQMITVDDETINAMIEKSIASEDNKFRYCFHENEKSMMQEMLFVIRKDSESKIHKHVDNAETQIILRGEAELLIYDENGTVVEKHFVSPSRIMLWRIGKNMFHRIMPITEEVVIYEVREGQFTSATNSFPSWSD